MSIFSAIKCDPPVTVENANILNFDSSANRYPGNSTQYSCDANYILYKDGNIMTGTTFSKVCEVQNGTSTAVWTGNFECDGKYTAKVSSSFIDNHSNSAI